MLFNSVEYIFLFIPIVFTIYFLIQKFHFHKTAKFFLLAASLFFYGSYKINYVYIIICSILFNYSISALFRRNISKRTKLFILVSGITGNIGILLFFKYFNFLASVLKDLDINVLSTFSVILPLGISFFTLQQISYIVDCYKEDIKEYNLLDYSLFVCFFPQLIAGPIVRHREMIPQFNNPKNTVINQRNIFIGLFLITVGLLKKTVFADSFSTFTAFMSGTNIQYDFITAWLLGITKMFVCYFDFSGYCDIALGSASLFNISLPWNFNSPFQAKNIIEYWKRWNMTLIRFLREYIYNPLGANKKGELKTYFNIMVIFTIMGIWVGFNPVNILSCVIGGVFVCINKLWQKFNIKMHTVISRTITLISTVIIGQFFVSNDIHQVTKALKSMFGIATTFKMPYIMGADIIYTPTPSNMLKVNWIILILGIIILLFVKNSNRLAKIYAKSNNMLYTIILVFVFLWAVLSLTKTSEFVYFVF